MKEWSHTTTVVHVIKVVAYLRKMSALSVSDPHTRMNIRITLVSYLCEPKNVIDYYVQMTKFSNTLEKKSSHTDLECLGHTSGHR